MKNNTISFIMLKTNSLIDEEMIKYIKNLDVPNGYSVEIIPINTNKNICKSYNEICKKLKSKIKIYVKDNVFIRNKNFLYEIIDIFKDKNVGMISMLGTNKLPTDFEWKKINDFYGAKVEKSEKMVCLKGKKIENKYAEVKIVDPAIIITQYDIKWRQDLFDNYFYGEAQGLEFAKKGFKVVVPVQDDYWIIDDGIFDKNSVEYKKNKEIFIKEYGRDIFPLVSILIPTYNRINYFKKALDSAIKQTYPNIEIIVCDNSTNYEIRNYMKNIKEDYIYYYKIKEELEVIDLFKLCIKFAKGEYATFLSDDNILNSNKINTMMDCFIKDSEIKLVTGYGIKINEFEDEVDLYGQINKIFENSTKVDGNVFIDFICETFYNTITVPTYPLFNTKDINEENFGVFNERKYKGIYNIATFLPLIYNEKIVYISDDLQYYRIHDEQYVNKGKAIIDSANDWYVFIEDLYKTGILNEEIYKKAKDKWIEAYKKLREELNNKKIDLEDEKYSMFKDFINTYDKEINKGMQFDDVNSNKKLYIKQDYNFKQLGEKTKIDETVEIKGESNISIGNEVEIDGYATILAKNNTLARGIVIKDNVKIKKRLTIECSNEVIIEPEVYIGYNVYISDKSIDYMKIGMPIKEKDNEKSRIKIGVRTIIENNCVIIGNLNIGRNCLIKSNSVIERDIPDFCVVENSVIKQIYDDVDNKWVEVKDDTDLEEVLYKREKRNPVLSICIPTYNRAEYLDKCLASIYNQIGNDNVVEVIISDNNSTDNTEQIVKKYMNKYDNLIYKKNSKNLGGDMNVYKVMELGHGEFINPHGDDDYFRDGYIYKIIDIINQHKECSVFYLYYTEGVPKLEFGKGKKQYLTHTSVFSTFISAIILKREQYFNIEKRDEFIDTKFNQAYVTFKVLEKSPDFCVMYDKVFESIGNKEPDRYNFAEVFIKNYIDMLKYFGFSKEEISEDKKFLFKNMILHWYKRILKENLQLELDDFENIVKEYYEEEEYYSLVVDKLRKAKLRYMSNNEGGSY